MVQMTHMAHMAHMTATVGVQCGALWCVDAGAMYFWLKDLTQEFLKLSIIYSSLEILDKARP